MVGGKKERRVEGREEREAGRIAAKVLLQRRLRL